MKTIKTLESYFDLFLDNFYIYHGNYRSTLLAYGMVKSKDSAKTVAGVWSNLKRKYPEDYKSAEDSYLYDLGMNRVSLYQDVLQIIDNAVRDGDRIKALELALKGLNELTTQDVQAAQTLKIEVVGSPAQMNDNL